MTPPEAAPMREDVTQADRDLAEAIVSHTRGYGVRLPNDGHAAIQLAARHRLAHTACPEAGDGDCDLCAGDCRGHSLGHPDQWEPEAGSRAARPDAGTDFYAARYAERCGDVLRLEGELAQARAALTARPEAGDEVERETYRQMHATAIDMGYPSILEALEDLAAMREGVDRGRVEREALPFYDAVKAYSYPSGIELTVRIHETGWDVYKPAPAAAPVTHEYAQSMVGHGEAQCIYCHGTNRENAVISPNVCEVRAAALSRNGG